MKRIAGNYMLWDFSWSRDVLHFLNQII